MTNPLDLGEAMRAALPPLFREIDCQALSGGILQPGTLQNQRCAGAIPPECFSRDVAGRVVIHRDKFLDLYYIPKLKRKTREPQVADRLRSTRRTSNPANL